MSHYFTESMTTDGPEPGHVICFQSDLVTLQQARPEGFAVRYGKEVHSELTYADACFRLGQALMHQLACEGLLDNGDLEDAA